ncbi:MAG: hypothetical protein OXO49_03165 [Gammaproteobacteria bacterium]|nr:hypothetical protein [Gammaproteobacteria bacterium]MDE0251979.1 hypothetical protein [Gammaproteobacteria bacterium]MDE0402913.1 hypothetical protein [Gammaproteobacteria bacterium]
MAARKNYQSKGIYCLETSGWDSAKDKSSVKPILEMLNRQSDLRVPYFYATIATKEEVSFHLERYAKAEFNTYPILYFAAHGTDDPPSISLWGADLSLEDLGERLKNGCKNRIVYFGSCCLMNVSDSLLNSFLIKTGAAAVCGYTEEVYWTESAPFDLLFFSNAQYWIFTPDNLIKGYRKDVENVACGLVLLSYRLKLRKNSTLNCV